MLHRAALTLFFFQAEDGIRDLTVTGVQTCALPISERAFQLERGGQWVKGKSCDTFAPLGPFLATPDEIRDVHDLQLWLKVNGETKQCSSTRELVFNVPALVRDRKSVV